MELPMMHVVCAIAINEKQEVFIARRNANKANPGEWEFPGGKVEEGEDEQSALIREIREEMDVDLIIQAKLGSVQKTTKRFRIELIAYRCAFKEPPIQSTDHDQLEWVSLAQLDSYGLSQPDRELLRLLNDPCSP